MGQESKTTLRWDGRIIEVTALLEGTELIFRGGVTMTIPFAEMMSVESNGGFLDFKTSRGLMMLELGNKADAWKEKIKNPKALIEKHADYFLGPLAAHQKVHDEGHNNSISHLRTKEQEAAWQKAIDRHGLAGLRTTRIQQYRA